MGSKLSFMMSNSKILSSPVVVILGATGTGKSKLAIEIAKKFNGEIISADSMQVYKGLDIITNKVTADEEKEIPHHFIGCTDSLNRFTVVDFQNLALPVIDNLLEKEKLPIIVGGTNYYIESLLWEVLLKSEVPGDTLLLESEIKQQKLENENNTSFLTSTIQSLSDDHKEYFRSRITQDSFKEVQSSELHNVLKQVDPSAAATLHPNDKRKIIRSLQIYQIKQLRHSDLLMQQKSQDGGSSLGGPLRYKNSIMLWIQCDKTVLEQRLDDRVDKMLECGLIQELLDFHKAYNQDRLQNNENPSYQEGIFQAIGFKEFHDYLILPEEKTTDKGKKIFKEGVELMKLHTRQYARKQNKWVVNRFLKAPDRDVPPVYNLDATDLLEWDKNVFQIAQEIVQSKLRGEECAHSPLPVEEKESNIKETYYCEICKKMIVGSVNWKAHLNSNRHFSRRLSLKRKAEIAELVAAHENSQSAKK